MHRGLSVRHRNGPVREGRHLPTTPHGWRSDDCPAARDGAGFREGVGGPAADGRRPGGPGSPRGPGLRRIVCRDGQRPRTERPDPKDKIPLFNMLGEARDLAPRKGRSERSPRASGRSLPRTRTSSTPGSRWATPLQGTAIREAIDHFTKALALKPDYDLAVINIAAAIGSSATTTRRSRGSSII